MINRKFSGPLGRATKFSHPRATMSVIVVMFIAANKFTAFCAIRLLDFRPTDHRRQQNIGGVRVLVASTTKGRRHARGRWGVEMRAAASSVSPWNNEACADCGSNAAPSRASRTIARRLHGRAVRMSGGAAFIALSGEIKPSDLMRAGHGN